MAQVQARVQDKRDSDPRRTNGRLQRRKGGREVVGVEGTLGYLSISLGMDPGMGGRRLEVIEL